MKLQLSEKQIKFLIKHRLSEMEKDESTSEELSEDEEISEQDAPASTSTSSSSGSGGGGTTGYPQVNKWESGVTRGPANQIGVTKWSDIVGSTLKRGKANQLK